MLTNRKIENLKAKLGRIYRINRSLTMAELKAEILSLRKRNGDYDDMHAMVAAAIRNAGIDIQSIEVD